MIACPQHGFEENSRAASLGFHGNVKETTAARGSCLVFFFAQALNGRRDTELPPASSPASEGVLDREGDFQIKRTW